MSFVSAFMIGLFSGLFQSELIVKDFWGVQKNLPIKPKETFEL